MKNEKYRAKVQEELQRLRVKTARAWVLRATPELIENFKICNGWSFSPEMCEAIACELERVSTDAA